MSAPGAVIHIGRVPHFVCGVCDTTTPETGVLRKGCCLKSWQVTHRGICLRCGWYGGPGILEYVYHIYYKCRRCGAWAKRHW